MNLNEWRLVFISICIILVLIVTSPLIVASLQQEGETFFAIAVLDEKGMTDNYYPDNNPEIEIDEKVLWNLSYNRKSFFAAV